MQAVATQDSLLQSISIDPCKLRYRKRLFEFEKRITYCDKDKKIVTETVYSGMNEEFGYIWLQESVAFPFSENLCVCEITDWSFYNTKGVVMKSGDVGKDKDEMLARYPKEPLPAIHVVLPIGVRVSWSENGEVVPLQEELGIYLTEGQVVNLHGPLTYVKYSNDGDWTTLPIGSTRNNGEHYSWYKSSSKYVSATLWNYQEVQPTH